MIDLTSYSNNELTLRVYNEEYFYIERHHPEYLLALVSEEFYYTPEQKEELLQQLASDLSGEELS